MFKENCAFFEVKKDVPKCKALTAINCIGCKFYKTKQQAMQDAEKAYGKSHNSEQN